MVYLVVELSKLQVLKQVEGTDLLDTFPLAGNEALEVLVTGRFKVDAANLNKLPGAHSMDLSLLSHQIEEENLVLAIAYQEPVVLVKLQFLYESKVYLAGTKLKVEPLDLLALLPSSKLGYELIDPIVFNGANHNLTLVLHEEGEQ